MISRRAEKVSPFDSVLLGPHSGTHRELGVPDAIGRWAPPHRIHVLEGHEFDEPTMKHEMLHDLLSYIGGFTHDDSLAFRVCDMTDEVRAR